MNLPCMWCFDDILKSYCKYLKLYKDLKPLCSLQDIFPVMFCTALIQRRKVRFRILWHMSGGSFKLEKQTWDLKVYSFELMDSLRVKKNENTFITFDKMLQCDCSVATSGGCTGHFPVTMSNSLVENASMLRNGINTHKKKKKRWTGRHKAPLLSFSLH